MAIHIHFNYASGSDTQASGAPYDMAAVYGTGASTTDGSTNVDLSADSPDLSGVPTDGTAALWVGSTAGQQWAAITAVNNTTKIVTVTSGRDYDVTETGRNWAIGGKRKVLEDNSQLFIYGGDWTANWEIVLEDDQTLTAVMPYFFFSTNQLIRSDVTGELRTINQTAQDAHVLVTRSNTKKLGYMYDIKLTNSHPNSTSGYGLYRTNNGAGSSFVCHRCEFGDEVNKLTYGCNSAAFYDCYIHHCRSYGTRGGSHHNCNISNNGHGCYSTNATVGFYNCVICDNDNDGISYELQNVNSIVAVNCTIANNGGDGIGYAGGSGGGTGGIVINCSITGNATYGIGYAAGNCAIQNNNFGSGTSANGSGAFSNPSARMYTTNNIYLDPQYLDEGNGDYRIPSNSPNANAAAVSFNNYSYRRSIGAADVVQDAGGSTGFYYLTKFIDDTDSNLGYGNALSTTAPLVNSVGATWVQQGNDGWTVSQVGATGTSATGSGYGGNSATNLDDIDIGHSDFKVTQIYEVSNIRRGGLVFRNDPATESYYYVYHQGLNGGLMSLSLKFNNGSSTSEIWTSSSLSSTTMESLEMQLVGNEFKLWRKGVLLTTQTLTSNQGHTRVGLHQSGSYSSSVAMLAVYEPNTSFSTIYPPETVGRQPAIPHPLYLS